MRIQLFTLAAVICLTACTTTSKSTSTITINGKTTTTTTITESGKTTTTTVTGAAEETTAAAGTAQAAAATEAAAAAETDDYDPNDPSGLRAEWADLFTGGAEGQNADGDRFYYAFDNVDEPKFASIVIVTEGGTKLSDYYIGDVTVEDGWFKIIDVESKNKLPYAYADSENADNYCLIFTDDDVAEVTPVDKDTIINDMAAVVENMYIVNNEILRQGLYKTDVYTSQISLDGCDTFTDAVDKNLVNGQAYANITLDGTDVLLLSGDAFEFEGSTQAVSAEVFCYNDGTPAYAGFVRSGGSADPLMINDGKLYAAGHHYAGKFTMTDGQLVIAAEAFETFDMDGSPTYHYASDDGGDYTNLDQDAAKQAFDNLFSEYMEGEIIEFSIVNK